MADGRNTIDNQDFIEGTDELAEILDDNFDTNDGMDTVDVSDGADDFSGDEWAEDLEDITLDDDDQSYAPMSAEKSEKNWFNIGVFGAVGVVICFILYSYLPGMLGLGGSAPVRPAPAPSVAGMATPADNAALLEQALNTSSLQQPVAQASLLDNPAILGEVAPSPERPDPEASDNRIFEALGNVPAISDNEVDDIFAAINDLQQERPATVITEEQPQILPVPADSDAAADEGDILEFIADTSTPRAPAVADTGVQSLGAQAVTAEVLPAETHTQPAVQTGESPDIAAMNIRMDAIMRQLESLALRVETLADAAPVLSAPATAVDNGKVQALEQTIRTLEKRIEALASEKAKAASAPSRPKTTTAQPKKTTAKPKAAPVKASPQWELRGAAQGQAYIAEKGTQNLRSVAVGDTLTGIGRITAIVVEGGRWVVRGTSGQITQ